MGFIGKIASVNLLQIKFCNRYTLKKICYTWLGKLAFDEFVFIQNSCNSGNNGNIDLGLYCFQNKKCLE